jgi:hypothetical protein
MGTSRKGVKTAVERDAIRAALSEARTLRGAQEMLSRFWPGTDPPVSVSLAYHRNAADLYRRIAEIDPAHHYEALYWAQVERETVQSLTDEMTASQRTAASSRGSSLDKSST